MSENEFVAIPDTIAGFPVHAMAREYPPMTQEAFEEMKRSLATHGQKQSVKVWNGRVIDGAHRMLALEQLGIDPLIDPVECTRVEAVELAFILNTARRHLTAAQKAYAVTLYEEQLENALKAEAAKGSGKKTKKPTRAKLAAQGGVSPRTVQKIAGIRRHGVPELCEALKRGQLPLREALAISELGREDQAVALEEHLATEHQERYRESDPVQHRTKEFDDFMSFILEDFCGYADVAPIMQRDPTCFVNELGDMIDLLIGARQDALSAMPRRV